MHFLPIYRNKKSRINAENENKNTNHDERLIINSEFAYYCQKNSKNRIKKK